MRVYTDGPDGATKSTAVKADNIACHVFRNTSRLTWTDSNLHSKECQQCGFWGGVPVYKTN